MRYQVSGDGKERDVSQDDDQDDCQDDDCDGEQGIFAAEDMVKRIIVSLMPA